MKVSGKKIKGGIEMRIEGFVLKVVPEMSKSQARRQRRKRGYEITMVGMVGGLSNRRTIPEIFVLKTAVENCPITRRVKKGDDIVVSADFNRIGLAGNKVVFEVRGMERKGKPFKDGHLYPWLIGEGCPVGEIAETAAQCGPYYTGI